MVVLISQGSVQVKPYAKPLSKYLYVPFASFHPRHTKKGLIRGELTRLIRLSSTHEAYLEARRAFYQHLRDRGYPRMFIVRIFNSIAWSERRRMFEPKDTTASTAPGNRLFFKIQYSPLCADQQLQRALQTNWTLPWPKPMFCFKRVANLRDVLVKSQLVSVFPHPG